MLMFPPMQAGTENRSKSRKISIMGLFMPLIGLLLAECGLQGPMEKNSPNLRVYFLEVKQGDACLIRTPGGRFYLCDTGKEDDLLAFQLQGLGVDTLRAVFITHPDFDHFGSFLSL